MIQRPRTPAIVTLLIVLVAGVLFLGFARRQNSPDAAEIAELQKAVALPNSPPATWLRFATRLQAAAQYPRAIAAYQHLLETDPYNKQFRLQCATCLALTGNSDDLFTFLQASLALDPKLTLNVLGRPEVATYRAEPRYVSLHEKAVAQSMD